MSRREGRPRRARPRRPRHRASLPGRRIRGDLLGTAQGPDEIVQAAVQEDVDVLGISILSGAHDTLVPKVIDGLEEYGALEDTLVIVGGIIPEEDREELYELGVAEIFGPGASMAETIEFVRENALDRQL